MSKRFNWGHGIALALLFFVIFIGSFVYKTFMVSKYDHKLVSEEYYKEELKYQDEIDRLNNATKLNQDVVVNKTNKGFQIVFPNEFDYKRITGEFRLRHISNDEFDIEKKLELDGLTFTIPDNQLVKGRYLLKLNWNYDSIAYQFKEKINY